MRPNQPNTEGTQPFAVVADNYATSSGDLTATHEIGHVLGGHHTADIATQAPVPIRARGYTKIFPAIGIQIQPFQTIMGSYGILGCPFNGPGPTFTFVCPRIAYFSNPDLDLPNTNLELGAPDRDMSDWLETGMSVVSNWTGNPTNVPAIPTLSVTSAQCGGTNHLDWNAVITATEYKLYDSTDPLFSNPNLSYNGTDTSFTVDVGFGQTWYLRVKSCNAAGCSKYSNQVSADYFIGCNP
jgi:hypothetical protein